MINRFYGSHIKSALEMGSVLIDVIEATRDRYTKRAEKTDEAERKMADNTILERE